MLTLKKLQKFTKNLTFSLGKKTQKFFRQKIPQKNSKIPSAKLNPSHGISEAQKFPLRKRFLAYRIPRHGNPQTRVRLNRIPRRGNRDSRRTRYHGFFKYQNLFLWNRIRQTGYRLLRIPRRGNRCNHGRSSQKRIKNKRYKKTRGLLKTPALIFYAATLTG